MLRHAISSALTQTYPSVEVVVVGDGCTDDSERVVASFADERVRWHNLSENSGSQSAPNNAGLALARGEYAAYLGHDDLWLPSHLDFLMSAMVCPSTDVAHTVAEVLGPAGSNIRSLSGLAMLDRQGLQASIPPSSVMHRRGLVDEIGPWNDHRAVVLPPDTDFLWRAHLAGKRFASVKALTVLKFPSAYRPNSYREKRSDEQADYSRRMRAPGFVLRELLATTSASLLPARKRYPAAPPPPPDVPAGWYVRQLRRIRGLEEEP